MIAVALAGVAGLVAGSVLLALSHELLVHPVLQRENHRGHRLPTAMGLILVVALVAVEGARALGWVVGVGRPAVAPARMLVLVAVVGFGFLGAVDDLLGDERDRGLRGHLGALVRGRLSTGMVKLAGGAAFALVLAAVTGAGRGQALVDGALVALAANLGNLLDRAPGRTAKWALVAYVPIALAAGGAPVGSAAAALVGVTAALLWGDLRERFMLGDAGANALGAGLGMAVVLAVSGSVRCVVAGVLLALTLASEVVSFSRVIERVPPLRAFDRLGRLGPGGHR
ncbi:MAG: hypothetical protein AB7L84_15340 [Acidimicrobiia bacterium]